MATLVGLAAVVLSSCQPSSGASEKRSAAAAAPGPNLLLVVLDTTRADVLQLGRAGPAERTPRLRGLASAGAVFTHAYAHTATTAPSHATLFTSLPPLRHGLLRNGTFLRAGYETLAERLHEGGFQSAGFVSTFVLTDYFGFGQGFDFFDGDTHDTGGDPPNPDRPCDANGLERCGEDTVAAALRWLSAKRDSKRPFFLFVHLYDPHAPYVPPPEYAYPDHHIGRIAEEPPRCGENRPAYEREVHYADYLVGRLLDALDEAGLASSTLVVVTADHGEAFLEHGTCGHEIDLWEELVRVPLILRWPGHIRRGLRLDARIGLIDVAPTVLDLLGVERGSAMQGRSFAAVLRGEGPAPEDAPLFYERVRYEPIVLQGHAVAGDELGVRLGRWKYTEAPDEHRGALYDLDADPGERENLIERRPEVAKRLAALVARWRERELGEGEVEPEARVAPEVREKLRALGYAP